MPAVIYKIDGGFVISSKGTWLPGSYDSERTARYAFRFKDAELHELQTRKNVEAGGIGGAITFKDLKALRA